jgi:hypothetical protein
MWALCGKRHKGAARRWGMAQIASRAFGGIADPGMAPYIDLFNHNEAASHPVG